MKATVLFEKRNKILAVRGTESNEGLAMVLLAELMHLGFSLSQEAYETIKSMSSTAINDLYTEIIKYVRVRQGSDRNYRPFYKNFPQDVMNSGDFMLWWNAMKHYWTGGLWEPTELKARGFALERTDFTPITLGTEENLNDIFTSLLGSNGSLTPRDKEIVKWFFLSQPILKMPERIPFKENLCIAASMAVGRNVGIPVQTATDVLRIAVFMSGGDISLPMVPKPSGHWMRIMERNTFKFRKFKRSERRFILGLLDQVKNPTEDMWCRRGRWLRLGEILHPGEYSEQYKNAASAFQTIRNAKVTTFGSKVDMARRQNKYVDMMELLRQRPGELVRRLDDIIRDHPSLVSQTMLTFRAIVDDVSVPVLLQLYEHFSKRSSETAVVDKVIMLKGRRARAKKISREVLGISSGTQTNVLLGIRAALGKKFSTRSDLGKVWIDPGLYKVPVPQGMRSASAGLRTLIRGTRLPLGDHAYIRGYVHWFDEDGNQDIDLSAVVCDENLHTIRYISFHDLSDQRLGMYHSGDIRHRRGACAEYIDVDIAKVVKGGGRYVLYTTHNYNSRPLHSVSQCVFGWMKRDFPKANEVFLPNTISEAFALTQESTGGITVAFDLVDREVIWLDLEDASNVIGRYGSLNPALELVKEAKHKLSVGELLEIHVEARGLLVSKKEYAETVMPYDLVYSYDKILSEYM